MILWLKIVSIKAAICHYVAEKSGVARRLLECQFVQAKLGFKELIG